MKENLDILYDHYKDTVQYIKEDIKKRNRYFLINLILISVLCLFIIDPYNSEYVFKSLIENSYNIKFTFNLPIIKSILWIFILYFYSNYFRLNTYIDRQYHYIENTENELSKRADFTITRESASYLKNYPLLNDVIDIFYKFIFPIIFIIIVIINIINEFIIQIGVSFFILNSIFATIIITLTILFLIENIKEVYRHYTKKKRKKQSHKKRP